jgi:hypothetical protein
MSSTPCTGATDADADGDGESCADSASPATSRARMLRSSSLQLELSPDGTMRAQPSQVNATVHPHAVQPVRRVLSESTNGNQNENSLSAAVCHGTCASHDAPTELLVATIIKQPSTDLSDMIGSLSANNKRRYSVHPKCMPGPQSQLQSKVRTVAAVSR